MSPNHFLTGEELSQTQLAELLDRAVELKRERESVTQSLGALAGRSVALIFDKPSTRTRISFEVGVTELGGTPLVLREGELQLSRGESLKDTALVMSRYVHCLVIRTGAHAIVEELAAAASLPVINGLTESHHPCQALADLLTLKERFGDLDGLRLAYVGDGNNVANSLMLVGGLAGVDVVVASPEALTPDLEVVQRAQAIGTGEIEVTTDPYKAVAGANAIYTDVWTSMGDEDEADERNRILEPYRVDADLVAAADGEAIVLHCLPAHPGQEITGEVLYGPRAAVWDQAENRLHAQKALLELLISK